MAQRPLNTSALYGADVRRLSSSKDVTLYDEEGNLLSTVESFNATMNFSVADFQPLGSPIRQAFLTGYSISIEISNCIVESEMFLEGAADFMQFGRHSPVWTLRSVVTSSSGDDNEEIFIWRDCVPEGDWNISNFSVGEIIKRTLRLRCNAAPELQKAMRS